MKKRIVGIDVARALAIFGMIIVNFKVVFGAVGGGWLKSFANIFDGKAAATFVVLAGIGLALMTNSAIKNGDAEKLKKAYYRIIKRALFLFVVGLSYISIWPADILHFYGIYMLITLLFITSKSKVILSSVGSIILLFPFLLIFFNYETGWDFTTLVYDDLWSIAGFMRNLFFNGFHPVLPWTAFMLFGLWFGKQNLNNDDFVKKSFWISLMAFIMIQIVSYAAFSIFPIEESQANQDLLLLFDTSPMPPLPIYMLNGIAIATTVISGCILLARKFEENIIINGLNKTGQLALTFYVAHVIIGMGLIDEFGPKELGKYSIQFSLFSSLAFSLCCVLFAVVWLHFRKSGPLEWIIRKLTG